MPRIPDGSINHALSKHYWTAFIQATSPVRRTHVKKVPYRKFYQPLDVLEQLRRDLHGRGLPRQNPRGMYMKTVNHPPIEWDNIDCLRGFLDGVAHVHRTNELLLSHADLNDFVQAVERMTNIPLRTPVAYTTKRYRVYVNARETRALLKALWGAPHFGAHWSLHRSP